MDTLIGLLICAGIVALFYRSEQKRKKLLKDDDEVEEKYIVDGEIKDEIPQYAFVFAKYRGMVFSMRENEKKEIWDRMSRAQRNEQLEAMKKGVKHGKITIEKLDESTWLYVPNRSDLKQIRDDYNKFVSLGGKLDDGN